MAKERHKQVLSTGAARLPNWRKIQKNGLESEGEGNAGPRSLYFAL